MFSKSEKSNRANHAEGATLLQIIIQCFHYSDLATAQRLLKLLSQLFEMVTMKYKHCGLKNLKAVASENTRHWSNSIISSLGTSTGLHSPLYCNSSRPDDDINLINNYISEILV